MELENNDRTILLQKEQELREKYNPDNLFKKHSLKQEENVIMNEVSMVEYKEPLFKRFINKIKNIFHIY